MQGQSFALAIADFHAPSPMIWSREALPCYLYGLHPRVIEGPVRCAGGPSLANFPMPWTVICGNLSKLAKRAILVRCAGPALVAHAGQRSDVKHRSHLMLPDISIRGPALHNTLRLAALLCLLSACDNNGAPDNAPPSPARVEGEVFRDTLKDGGEGPAMVVLPTGRFRMGSPSVETGRDRDEGPVRMVNISQRIAMGRYEVTFADYDRFVAATSGRRPSDRGWSRGSRPVINVNWHEAKAYATWLSAQTGKTYRLPSEAEWEYAARAGTSTRYSWGDEIGVNRANCDGCGSEWDNTQTAPVGRFAANAFGLFDMHGNVYEWVEDCYVDSYAGAPSDGSARTSGCGTNVWPVLRGGSRDASPRFLRSASRYWHSPSNRYFGSGFRLVQDLNP